jgi:hypothetical protein
MVRSFCFEQESLYHYPMWYFPIIKYKQRRQNMNWTFTKDMNEAWRFIELFTLSYQIVSNKLFVVCAIDKRIDQWQKNIRLLIFD